jgi:hypothetical protein
MGEENTYQENAIIAEVKKLEGKTSYKCTVYTACLGEDEEVDMTDNGLVIADFETEATRPLKAGEQGSVLLTDLVLSATQSSKSKAVRKINQALAQQGYAWRVDSSDVYIHERTH